MKLSLYWQAIVTGLAAALVTMAADFNDSRLDLGEWIQIILAFLAGAGVLQSVIVRSDTERVKLELSTQLERVRLESQPRDLEDRLLSIETQLAGMNTSANE